MQGCWAGRPASRAGSGGSSGVGRRSNLAEQGVLSLHSLGRALESRTLPQNAAASTQTLPTCSGLLAGLAAGHSSWQPPPLGGSLAPADPGIGAAPEGQGLDLAQIPAQGSGLTVASLKHLRRKSERLGEDKARLEKDILQLQAELREHRERCPQRVAELEFEVREAVTQELATRGRAAELEARSSSLEGSLIALEAEMAPLRETLQEQSALLHDASERRKQLSHRVRALEEREQELGRANRAFQQQKVELEEQKAELERANEELEEQKLLQQAKLREALAERDEARAEAVKVQQHCKSVMLVVVKLQEDLERLRSSTISEAVKNRIVIHVLAPKVVLNYNNAPPISFSPCSPSATRIREVVSDEVTPHFSPLWASVDGVDRAPDGTAAKAYADAVADLLTKAVQSYVESAADGPPPAPSGGP